MNHKEQTLFIINSLLTGVDIHSLEELCLSFLSLNNQEKKEIFSFVDHLDNTLLMDAIDYSKEDLAFTLLDLGFDPNSKNIKGMNPLILACRSKSSKLANHLIEITTDLDFARSSNGKKNGDTALIFATDKGLLSVVKKLIDFGADPFYKNEFHQHALFYAIKPGENKSEIFDYLLPLYIDKINDVNLLGDNILYTIFKYGSLDNLDSLIKNKIDFKSYSDKNMEYLKSITANNYKSSSESNNFKQFNELVTYWDKARFFISLDKKLNKSNSSSKPKKI